MHSHARQESKSSAAARRPQCRLPRAAPNRLRLTMHGNKDSLRQGCCSSSPMGAQSSPPQALPTCTPGEAQPVARRKAPTAHCRYSAWRDALRGSPSRSAGSST